MARKKKQLSIVLTNRNKENNTDILDDEPSNSSLEEINQVNLEYSEKTVIENNENTEEISDNLKNETNYIEPHLSNITLDTQIDIIIDTQQSQLEEVNTTQPQVEEADTMQPQPEEADTTQPQLEEANTMQPQPEEADTTQPQSEEADTTQPQVEEADTQQPQSEEADTQQPQSEEADTTQPQSEEADTTQPQVEEADTMQPQLEEADTISISPDIPIDIIIGLEDNRNVNILETKLLNEVIEPIPNIFNKINIDNSILSNCIIKDTTLSNVCFDNVTNNIDFTNNLINGQYYKVLALEKIKQYHTVEKLIYNGKLYVKHTDPFTTNLFLGIAQNNANPGEIVTVLISGISLITIRKNINLPILKHNINGQLSVIRDKNNKYITQSFDIPVNKNDLLVLAGTSNDILVGPLTKYYHFNTANCCGLLSPYKSVIVNNNLIFNINYNEQNTILNQKNNLGNKFIQVLDINLNTGEILGYLP
jgi:uncharacterized protein YjbI with pentapeptide repeats